MRKCITVENDLRLIISASDNISNCSKCSNLKLLLLYELIEKHLKDNDNYSFKYILELYHPCDLVEEQDVVLLKNLLPPEINTKINDEISNNIIANFKY